MTPRTEAADVVVLGGGLAGLAASLAFARLGRRVLLLERDRSSADGDADCARVRKLRREHRIGCFAGRSNLRTPRVDWTDVDSFPTLAQATGDAESTRRAYLLRERSETKEATRWLDRFEQLAATPAPSDASLALAAIRDEGPSSAVSRWSGRSAGWSRAAGSGRAGARRTKTA